jgi:hypothetical protein
MEMSKARNAVLVPTGLLVMAGVLLFVLLIRAQIVMAPAPTMHHATLTAPGGAPGPGAQGSSNTAATSQQTITSNGSTKPLAPPTAGTPPNASESLPTPGSAQCPSAPGSGLPCKIP